MPARHVPVRPNLEQLKHQAKDLLRQVRRGEEAALADLREFHPQPPPPADAKLADAQLALARSYGVASWPRLVIACKLIEAIWNDDADAVRALVLKHPPLLHEMARGTKSCNWGPPMSYAANLGRGRIIAMLRGLGAADLQHAFDRAALQGQLDTARQLHAMGARLEPGLIMGTAETLSDSGMAMLLDLGAPPTDAAGDRLAPVGMVLETYGRDPEGKHRCLELLAAQGIELPDTPTMAVHRGRLDLLEAHVRRDPRVLSRTFSHREIFPPELGCHEDPTLALGGTPVGGGTLLHLCVEYDEGEILRWLIARGADANARASVDAEGFGGYTPLFNCVVVQSFRLRATDEFARLLLDHRADPNARASLRKALRGVDDESTHEYRDVTPLSWGRRFHDQSFVSKPTLQLIADRGGRP